MATKRRRKYAPREDQRLHASEGETAKYLRFNLTLADMPPVDFSDVQTVKDRIHLYFLMCIEQDMRPTITALSLALGVNRRMFSVIEAGSKGKEVALAFRGAKAIVEAQLQDYMHNGAVNPLQGMFELNNNYGYKNQIDVVTTDGSELLEDSKQIAMRYNQALTDDLVGEDGTGGDAE